MSVQAGNKYEATVKEAFVTESSKKATAGLFMVYTTSDGEIDKTWWITPATAERLLENLGTCFNITKAQMLDDEFIGAIGTVLRGQVCSITTEEASGPKGEPIVEVQWMNPAGYRPKKLQGGQLKRISGLFAGGPVSSPEYVDRMSDDVPF